MNRQEYNCELLELALSLGFRGHKDEKGNIWLATKYKGKVVPIETDPSSEDLFCGKGELILRIIDERLGIETESEDLSIRSRELGKAFSDINHKFWDKAKRFRQGGQE